MKSQTLQTMKSDSDIIESALTGYLNINDYRIPILFDAMKYSVLGGGKRIRPFLVLEFAKLAGADIKKAVPFACAIEMIHNYSLVHDDLPCMDNDDLRRGQPTTHKKFGYANALLCGDGLLTYAFRVCISGDNSDDEKIRALKILSECAGPLGMVGGQQIDLDSENKNISKDLLIYLHSLKTGALIKCACQLGCIAAGIGEDDEMYKNATEYAENIGVVFQIIDDILDVVGDEKIFGKPIGSDKEQGKTTFLSFMSIDDARVYAKELTEKAKSAISGYGGCDILCDFADYLLERDK